MTAPRVELRQVEKRFGGVHAVVDASLQVGAGEVLGLLGHNGAGKSTLVKGLSGAVPVDSGEILLDGTPARIRSPRDARRLGVEMVYQNLALAENLAVAANLFLGREITTRLGLLDEEAMERAARDVITRLNPRFQHFSEPVRSLSGGERQTVAIARAVHFDARVLVLDEPTAALGPEETRAVGEVVQGLRAAGLAVLLVSHDLHDVLALADRVAVMRAGRIVATRRADEVTPDELVALIVAARPDGAIGPGATRGRDSPPLSR